MEFLRLEAVERPGSDSRDDPVLADPSAFATDNAARFDALFAIYTEDMAKQLGDGGSELWSAFKANTSDKWSDTDRQTLLSRYLGFPLWDGMIFPTISMTRLPQFTPIGVSQFSPLMATKLTALDEKGNPTEKLMGIPFKHFAGFFDAKSRENGLSVGPFRRCRTDSAPASGGRQIGRPVGGRSRWSRRIHSSPGRWLDGGARHRGRLETNFEASGKPEEAGGEFSRR